MQKNLFIPSIEKIYRKYIIHYRTNFLIKIHLFFTYLLIVIFPIIIIYKQYKNFYI